MPCNGAQPMSGSVSVVCNIDLVIYSIVWDPVRKPSVVSVHVINVLLTGIPDLHLPLSVVPGVSGVGVSVRDYFVNFVLRHTNKAILLQPIGITNKMNRYRTLSPDSH